MFPVSSYVVDFEVGWSFREPQKVTVGVVLFDFWVALVSFMTFDEIEARLGIWTWLVVPEDIVTETQILEWPFTFLLYHQVLYSLPQRRHMLSYIREMFVSTRPLGHRQLPAA
jgi:hypothetical protein